MSRIHPASSAFRTREAKVVGETITRSTAQWPEKTGVVLKRISVIGVADADWKEAVRAVIVLKE